MSLAMRVKKNRMPVAIAFPFALSTMLANACTTLGLLTKDEECK